MRPLPAALLLCCALLSGCSGGGGDGDAADGGSSSSGTRGSSSRSGTNATAPQNHAPTASLSAKNGSADAPLDVTFRLNATDADRDPLTWILDFGDGTTANGTFGSAASASGATGTATSGNATLAANATHSYAEGGLYNATLSVSDGNATTNVTLALDLEAGSPFAQFVASGTPDLPCPQCSEAGANTGVGYRAGVNELDSWFVEIPADAVGQPFTLASTEGDPDMVFRDGCSGGAAVGDTFQADGPEAGVVPEGAVCALTWEPGAPGSTITLTIG